MGRILVMDVDPSIRAAIRAWLEVEGFDVMVAECATDGLSAFDQSRFDVAIIDIFIPGMNGFDLLKTLRQRAPTTPIIAISGLVFNSRNNRPAPDFLRMATAFGAAHCLRKPFRPADLLTLIERCLPGAAVRPEDGSSGPLGSPNAASH